MIRKYGRILIIFISFLFFFASCSSERKTIKEPIYGKYVDEIVDSYLKHIKKQYGLECFGTGGGFLSNVNNISLHFDAPSQKINIGNARVLLINCTEELLQRINKNEQIRPYLEHYPFTSKGISINVIFYDYLNEKLPEEFLKGATVTEGVVYYSRYNQKTEKFEDFYKEPYSEALEKVKESGQLQQF